MVLVILSPHLDDAVLSCWHLLEQTGDVMVINVFAGAPAGTSSAAWWDQLTGAVDSGQRMRERIDEDREALALAGRTAENLAFLDEQYRDAEQPLEPVVAEIGALLVPDALVYAPAAFFGHADHVVVRSAALELRQAGFEVSLYADLPHATVHGWPPWVRGGGATSSPDLATALWNRTLAGTEISLATMAAAVHRLDPHAHARKLEAVHVYRTQLAGLVRFVGRGLSGRETLGYEVTWGLPRAVTPRPDCACSRAAPGP